MIKTTLGVYLLLEKRHNVETSSRIFGRGSTNGETSAIRSTLYSLGSAIPFIMVHLIKPTQAYGCVSRESCAPQPWNASKSRWEHSGDRKELIGRYQKF